MTVQKTLFFITLVLIVINLIVLDINKIEETGIIDTIKYTNNIITITIKNNPNTYILFTNQIINIKENDKVKIIGKESTYKNQKQIVVNKLIKIIE